MLKCQLRCNVISQGLSATSNQSHYSFKPVSYRVFISKCSHAVKVELINDVGGLERAGQLFKT